MNAIVIEHVSVADLPSAWQAQLAQPASSHVTVRIETECAAAELTDQFSTDDPAFGIWRDREDMPDVAAYVRKLREPRYGRDGSSNAP